MLLLEILLHPLLCLILGVSSFFFWCSLIRKSEAADLEGRALFGIPHLIRTHKYATIRVPLDVVSFYILAIVFVATYGFQIPFFQIEKLPQMDGNLIVAIGAGAVEAFFGICAAAGSLKKAS